MAKYTKHFSGDFKKSELAKIHIAKKQLGLDDETYRAMLKSVAGVDSSKDLDAEGRAKVLDYLKKSGFKADSSAKTKGKPSVGQDRVAQIGKIEALLADAKRPWEYVNGMAQHMYGKDRLTFCDPTELSGIIAALVKDKKRREVANG